MLKKYLKTMLITSLILLLPILAGLILWNQLPDTIAIHWGADGTPDGWSGKFTAVFGLPLFLLACHWLCLILSAADPKKHNLMNSKAFSLILWIIPFLSLVCGSAVLMGALGLSLPVERILPALLGILFIVIGNYLPKCRPSYTLGIKLPWTLADEENWQHTHRIAGVVWIIGGLLILLSAVFHLPYVMFASFIAMIAVPTVYSYIFHIKKTKKERE